MEYIMFGSDKNFKMPKSVKRLMASFGGRTRIEFKHAMIRAIVTAVKAPPKRDRNQKEDKDH
jgi:hypothetical protein